MIIQAFRELRARFSASRLSTKILILSAFTTLLPLLVLTALVASVNSANLRQQLLQSLRQQATSQAAEIDAELSAWKREASALAANPTVSAYLSNPAAGDQTATRIALQQASNSDPAGRGGALVDTSGRVVLATDPATGLGPPHLSTAAYFRSVMRGQSAVSDLILTDAGGAPILYAASAVNQGGRIVGAALLRLDASEISNLYTPSRLDAQDHWGLLVDGNGVVIGYIGPAGDQVLYLTVGSPQTATLDALRRRDIYAGRSLLPLDMTSLAAQLNGTGPTGTNRVMFPLT